MKRFDALGNAGTILGALRSGVLLTSQAHGRANAMVISWGGMGIEWGKPVFTAYVRKNRFTHGLLMANPEFTVNIPSGPLDSRIMRICGAESGRDRDKIAAAGLTLVEAQRISVPAIRELPLTLECKVVCAEPQDPALLAPALRERYYPQHVDGTFAGSNRDAHTAFYGEIVDAYMIEG